MGSCGTANTAKEKINHMAKIKIEGLEDNGYSEKLKKYSESLFSEKAGNKREAQ